MPEAKENKKQAEKRQVTVIGLKVAKGKQHLKEGEEYKVTKGTAESLIKNKQAKKK